MNRAIVRVLSCFVLDRERRRRFRQRLLHPPRKQVICGTGNEIVNCPPGVEIHVHGNGNRIEFREPLSFFRGLFMIGTPESPVSNTRVTIGERTSCQHATVWVMEDGSAVSIGKDCMISKDVEIWSTDAHAIVDSEGRLLNGGAHSVTIGDHCWIGFRACILKNAKIADGVVVGMGAVVAGGRPLVSGGVYAGNPARLVRENVRWDMRSPQGFLNDRSRQS